MKIVKILGRSCAFRYYQTTGDCHSFRFWQLWTSSRPVFAANLLPAKRAILFVDVHCIMLVVTSMGLNCCFIQAHISNCLQEYYSCSVTK